MTTSTKRTKTDISTYKTEIIKQITYYKSLSINISLRQLYYRLVSLGIIENKLSEYKFLSKKTVEWRKDLTIDDIFTDEGRIFHSNFNKTNPLNYELNLTMRVIQSDEPFALLDFQPIYTEIWMEKLALNSIFQPICDKYNINFQICRGYSSYTIIKHAILRYESIDIPKQILYFGDFDPSGLDIFRNLQKELKHINNLTFKRIAITLDQAKSLSLIPAPTKEDDSRTKKFLTKYSDETYELDAIEPTLLQQMIETSIKDNIDMPILNYNQKLSKKRNILYQKYLLNRIKRQFNLKDV